MKLRFFWYFIPKQARMYSNPLPTFSLALQVNSYGVSLLAGLWLQHPLSSSGTLMHVPRQQGPPPIPHPSNEDQVHRVTLLLLLWGNTKSLDGVLCTKSENTICIAPWNGFQIACTVPLPISPLKSLVFWHCGDGSVRSWFFSFFVWQVLIYSRLAANSLCSWGWLWTPDSMSQCWD